MQRDRRRNYARAPALQFPVDILAAIASQPPPSVTMTLKEIAVLFEWSLAILATALVGGGLYAWRFLNRVAQLSVIQPSIDRVTKRLDEHSGRWTHLDRKLDEVAVMLADVAAQVRLMRENGIAPLVVEDKEKA